MKMLKTILMLLLPLVMITGDDNISLLEAFSTKEGDEAMVPRDNMSK